LASSFADIGMPIHIQGRVILGIIIGTSFGMYAAASENQFFLAATLHVLLAFLYRVEAAHPEVSHNQTHFRRCADVTMLGLSALAITESLASEMAKPYLIFVHLTLQAHHWLAACGMGIPNCPEGPVLRTFGLVTGGIVLVWRTVFPSLSSTGLPDLAFVFIAGALGAQVVLHVVRCDTKLRDHKTDLGTFAAHFLLCASQDQDHPFVAAAAYAALVGGLAREGAQAAPVFFCWPLGLQSMALFLGPLMSGPGMWVVALCIALWRLPKYSIHHKYLEEKQSVELDTFHQQRTQCQVRLLDHSDRQILTEAMRDTIWHALPARLRLRDWCLHYCFERDGAGLSQLFRKLKSLSRRSQHAGCILLVKDEDNGVCGAYASTPWEPQSGSFGTGETFVFSFPGPVPGKVWHWERTDECFLMAGGGDSGFLAVGGGDSEMGQGAALWLDHELRRGSSSPSFTFGSECLARKSMFNVLQVEVWVFA